MRAKRVWECVTLYGSGFAVSALGDTLIPKVTKKQRHCPLHMQAVFGGRSEEAHVCLGREYTPDAAMPVDTLVEIINEAFSDGFGDVIIEPTDDGYAIIDDYKEDITEWLNRIMK